MKICHIPSFSFLVRFLPPLFLPFPSPPSPRFSPHFTFPLPFFPTLFSAISFLLFPLFFPSHITFPFIFLKKLKRFNVFFFLLIHFVVYLPTTSVLFSARQQGAAGRPEPAGTDENATGSPAPQGSTDARDNMGYANGLGKRNGIKMTKTT